MWSSEFKASPVYTAGSRIARATQRSLASGGKKPETKQKEREKIARAGGS